MTDAEIVRELTAAKNVVALRFDADAMHDVSGAKQTRKGRSYKQAQRIKPIIIIVVGKGGACVRHERPEATVYICGATGLK